MRNRLPIITNSELIDRWTSFYGRSMVNSFQYLNKAGINTVIRVNYLKTTDEELIPKLIQKGIEVEKLALTGTYKVLKQRMSIGATHEFLLGHYSIQGLASQFVSHIVQPAEQDKILDMSAAPGGKTAHLATLMNNKGLIIAVDSSKPRMTALRSNLSRLSVYNVIGIQGDSITITSELGTFDKVLLDAPCSGSGSICKRPTKEWSKDISDINRLAEKQSELLYQGLQCLKIGGELIYSTCSIEPEEGEEQIVKIKHLCGASIDILPVESSQNMFESVKLLYNSSFRHIHDELQDKWLRIVPKDDYEGFFICKIKKLSKLLDN